MSRFDVFAYNGTATRRREYRREIRGILGSSSQPAPDAMDALRCVNQLDLLLGEASGGEFSLRVVTRDGETLRPLGAISRLIEAADALKRTVA